MLMPFCGGARAVLLTQTKSWVDASTRSEFFKIIVAAAAEAGTNRANGRLVFSVWTGVSDTVGEALLERALASCIAKVGTRELRCLRWKRPWERVTRVGLPDVGEARQGSLETEVDERCHNRYSN